jgi:filamentous hemagglutinin family protein
MAHQTRKRNWRSLPTPNICPALVLGSVLSGLVLGVTDGTAIAQIVPDNTLGNERSHLTPQDVIEGGATRGVNLFHSFSEFNIGEGQQVYFANPNGIQRILTRVTGTTRSEILGTLGVLGNADLFLINPNGILFGPNARLDVSGSFVASTADRLIFANGEFSATTPQAPPLLTISVPIGLQYGGSAGAIQVQSASLAVQPNQTLALLGGDILLKNAALAAPGGQVELGGVTAGTIDLNSQVSLPAAARANLEIDSSTIDVQGTSGGQIRVLGQNILLQDSKLLTGLGSQAALNATAGDVSLDATQRLALNASSVTNNIDRYAVGKGGNIRLNAGSLVLTDNSLIATTVSGEGNAGDITIQVRDSLVLDSSGIDSRVSRVRFPEPLPGGVGNAGNISIETGSISFIDRSQFGGEQIRGLNAAFVSASTEGFGNAGKITIAARDTISMDGGEISSDLDEASIGEGQNITLTARSIDLKRRATVRTFNSGDGNAGDIIIKSETFALRGGEIVSTLGAFGQGSGGDVTITADSIAFANSSIQALTFGRGDAGNIQLRGRDRIALDRSVLLTEVGRLGDGTMAQGKGGDLTIDTNRLTLTRGALLSTSTSGIGKAGDLRIVADAGIDLSGTQWVFNTSGNLVEQKGGLFASTQGPSNAGTIHLTTHQVVIRDRAEIGVRSTGAGEAGNLEIVANSLWLDRGTITAESASGSGGNLVFNLDNLLLLRRGSTITTTAGTAQAGGDGGNIAIATNFLVAFPTENSNIAADAFTGRGGNINITTQGIFGIEFRDRQTPRSDITASSQFGINGVVTINTPDIDPTQGTVELPTTFSTPSLARGCQTRGNNTSSFVNTGRGGVPTNPTDPLIADTLWQDLELLGETEKGAREQPTTNQQQLRTENSTSTIIEAQGWVVLSNGTIVLTAQPFRVTPYGIESQGRLFCY